MHAASEKLDGCPLLRRYCVGVITNQWRGCHLLLDSVGPLERDELSPC